MKRQANVSKSLLVLAGTCVIAACGPSIATLTPATNSVPVSGDSRAAKATVAGVVVIARAEAWRWNPRDLKDQVTPILIDLQNTADYPVQVRYNRIWLTDTAGHQFTAVPPYDVDGTITEAVTVRDPFYGLSRFSVAPYLTRWYPGMLRYDGVFAYDPAYYGPRVTRYRNIALPTAAMVTRALPEGVLQPGGKASGFVYFEALHTDAHAVTLTFELIDASTNVVLGTASIPFVAR